MGDSAKGALQIVEPLDPADETCRTFVISKEDHTLGNALRYMVMKNPDTQFCGYSVPHPSEHKINLRVQTSGPSAVDVLHKGLEDLIQMCEHVGKTFERSMENYVSKSQNEDTSMDMGDS